MNRCTTIFYLHRIAPLIMTAKAYPQHAFREHHGSTFSCFCLGVLVDIIRALVANIFKVLRGDMYRSRSGDTLEAKRASPNVQRPSPRHRLLPQLSDRPAIDRESSSALSKPPTTNEAPSNEILPVNGKHSTTGHMFKTHVSLESPGR